MFLFRKNTEKEESPVRENTPAPEKKKSKSAAILTIIFITAFLILVFCGIKLFSIMDQYHEAREQYEEAEEVFVTEVEPTAAVEAAPFPIDVDFDELRKVCPDIIGWLYSPDTVISYPVAQSDDNDYYLRRYMDGSYLYAGTLFADFQCRGDFTGKNTVIYGHHMNDGSMFASLVKYRDQSYFDEHPVMYLATPTGNYIVEIFSAFTGDYQSFAYTINFPSLADYSVFLSNVCSLSDIETGVVPGPDECIITLSTCTYEFEDARYIVQGVLRPM